MRRAHTGKFLEGRAIGGGVFEELHPSTAFAKRLQCGAQTHLGHCPVMGEVATGSDQREMAIAGNGQLESLHAAAPIALTVKRVRFGVEIGEAFVLMPGRENLGCRSKAFRRFAKVLARQRDPAAQGQGLRGVERMAFERKGLGPFCFGQNELGLVKISRLDRELRLRVEGRR